MRIALTVAMFMAAGIAWANEPPAEAQAEPVAAEAVPAQAAEPAAAAEAAPAEATAAEGAATEAAPTDASTTQESTAAAAAEDDKPFKVPAGYRAKTVGGKQMYCKSSVTLGSRFGKEQCRTEAQLREIEKQKTSAPMPDSPSCSGTCASK